MGRFLSGTAAGRFQEGTVTGLAKIGNILFALVTVVNSTEPMSVGAPTVFAADPLDIQFNNGTERWVVSLTVLDDQRSSYGSTDQLPRFGGWPRELDRRGWQFVGQCVVWYFEHRGHLRVRHQW